MYAIELYCSKLLKPIFKHPSSIEKFKAKYLNYFTSKRKC